MVNLPGNGSYPGKKVFWKDHQAPESGHLNRAAGKKKKKNFINDEKKKVLFLWIILPTPKCKFAKIKVFSALFKNLNKPAKETKDELHL